MGNNKFMSGKTHTASSKPVSKCKCKSMGMKAGSCKKKPAIKIKQMNQTKLRVLAGRNKKRVY